MTRRLAASAIVTAIATSGCLSVLESGRNDEEAACATQDRECESPPSPDGGSDPDLPLPVGRPRFPKPSGDNISYLPMCTVDSRAGDYHGIFGASVESLAGARLDDHGLRILCGSTSSFLLSLGTGASLVEGSSGGLGAFCVGVDDLGAVPWYWRAPASVDQRAELQAFAWTRGGMYLAGRQEGCVTQPDGDICASEPGALFVWGVRPGQGTAHRIWQGEADPSAVARTIAIEASIDERALFTLSSEGPQKTAHLRGMIVDGTESLATEIWHRSLPNVCLPIKSSDELQRSCRGLATTREPSSTGPRDYVYWAGWSAEDDIYFDGRSQPPLHCGCGRSSFLAKLDAHTGQTLWTTCLGLCEESADTEVNAFALAVEPQGNGVRVAGSFAGAVSFGPTTVTSLNGTSDAMIVQVDTEGQVRGAAVAQGIRDELFTTVSMDGSSGGARAVAAGLHGSPLAAGLCDTPSPGATTDNPEPFVVVADAENNVVEVRPLADDHPNKFWIVSGVTARGGDISVALSVFGGVAWSTYDSQSNTDILLVRLP